MRFHRLWLSAYLFTFSLSSFAAAAKDDGFVPLFDGKTLNGWVVTGCKAGVEDGNLVILEARWYEFDVTAYVRSVKGTGKAGFALKNAMNTIDPLLFNSGENAFNQPQLVVT
jgi:hypothetical protein